MIPVCAIYSTFLQRAFDQIIHDVALQKLPVVFAMDRAGLVGADGPTHHGAFDLSYLRLIPNMTIMVPKDEQELRDMLFTATSHEFVAPASRRYLLSTGLDTGGTPALHGPVAIRYPRGTGIGVPLADEGFRTIPIGQGEMLRDGEDVAIIGVGPLLYEALKAAEDLEREGISVAVANARFVKPLDTALLEALAARFKHIVTLEENVVAGGFGSAVSEFYSNSPSFPRRGLGGGEDKLKHVLHLGLPDRFIDHGAPATLLEECGLTREGIRDRVREFAAAETTSILNQ